MEHDAGTASGRDTNWQRIVGLCVAIVLVVGLLAWFTRIEDDPVPAVSGQPASTDPLAGDLVEGDSGLVQLPRTDAEFDPDIPDPAADFLEHTTVIYERVLPSGATFEIRESDVSYGELFDIEWVAPTGSTEMCLSEPALFVGVSSGARFDRSRWDVLYSFPLSDQYPTSVHYSYGADFEAGTRLVVRTNGPALELGLAGASADADVAEFRNGVAVIEVGYDDLDSATEFSDPALRTGDGDIYPDDVVRTPAECFAGEFHGLPLPEPGGQPADVVAAEQEVRETHALLVDRSIPDEERPRDLLDDYTGVDAAVDQMNAGNFAESAAAATYTIDEVVFTDPATAWFRYTIDAPTGTFAGRFGQAVFNGDRWQVTRQTICQDLALASGMCDPGKATEVLQPMPAAEVDRIIRDFDELRWSYDRAYDCNPVQPCGAGPLRYEG